MSDKTSKKLDYVGKMILAPMVKIGTLPTRLLALDYGADLVYTEEIIDFRLLKSTRIENELLGTVDYIDESDGSLTLRVAPERERGHLVLQIGTNSPERAVKVAKIVEKDVDAIDVNMGCPKGFSLKGGMGAALLTQPEKVKSILTALVNAVDISVTCKIRILPKLEDTLKLIEVIQSTGVCAVGVHGRTKDQRPGHANSVEAIQEVVKHCKIPVIANGGSSNNRDSPINTYEGITSFWKETGAASVMIARAAEWNASVFRPSGKEDIYAVVDKYLDYVIHYDQPFVATKYNIQQHIGGDQTETEKGRKFLYSSTMAELCEVLGKKDQFCKRQEYIRNNEKKIRKGRTIRLEKVVFPQKRKFSELESDDLAIDAKKSLENDAVKEYTEMYCPFVRGHYENDIDLPKTKLLRYATMEKQPSSHQKVASEDVKTIEKMSSDVENSEVPKYFTWQKDKMFRSIVLVKGEAFSSQSWEKNKRYSEQAAAIVALHCLGVRKIQQDKGASTASGVVYAQE